eukprot:GFUD01118117.1.p1 GENE.GFUD01118117.1~~GFUD01118117.1.p1  ORF type:complete len:276 (-),score=12.63 GFUD01118117.1:255-1082(-)
MSLHLYPSPPIYSLCSQPHTPFSTKKQSLLQLLHLLHLLHLLQHPTTATTPATHTMSQLVLVLLAVVAGYAGAATIERCCTQKMVGGVNYTLVDDTKSTKQWGCHSDCIFERVDTKGSRFCFKSGDLEVVCPDDFWCDICVETPENNCLNCLKFCSPDPDSKSCVDCVNSECPVCLGPCGFTPFDECFFPNSQYNGADFIIYNNNLQAANYTDCQQLCNQQKGTNENTCKFWNYQKPMVSTFISCTLMYNITSIQSGPGEAYVRGPINENCPAHI